MFYVFEKIDRRGFEHSCWIWALKRAPIAKKTEDAPITKRRKNEHLSTQA